MKMNLLQLSALCHDKRSSVKFLQQRGIVHNTRRCTNNHVMTLSLTDRQDRWRCRQGTCQQDIPVRQGAWLQGSRLSYRQIVLFIYCWSKKLTSIRFCEMELEISKSSVIDWNHYCHWWTQYNCWNWRKSVYSSQKLCWSSIATTVGFWRYMSTNGWMFRVYCPR